MEQYSLGMDVVVVRASVATLEELGSVGGGWEGLVGLRRRLGVAVVVVVGRKEEKEAVAVEADAVVAEEESGFSRPDWRVWRFAVDRARKAKKAGEVRRWVVVGEDAEDIVGAQFAGCNAVWIQREAAGMGREMPEMVDWNAVCRVAHGSELGQEVEKALRWPMPKKICIGYYLNPKKQKKFERDNVFAFPQRIDVEFRLIDLDSEIKQQGDFVLLLLKTTDLLFESEWDPESSQRLRNLQSFIQQNPEIIVVDPLELVHNVTDRQRVSDLIIKAGIRSGDRKPVRTPFSVFAKNETLRRWAEHDDEFPQLKFPVICKRLQACGTRESHQMLVLPKRELLSELIPFETEWQIQEYINHGGVIHKVYVVGDYCKATTRISLPDFPSNLPPDRAVHFNSHDPVSPMMFSVDSEENIQTLEKFSVPLPEPQLPENLFKDLSSQIRSSLGLDLFGFDVLVDSKTACLYIVDINYFPSYKDIPEFPEILLDYLLRRIHRTQKAKQ